MEGVLHSFILLFFHPFILSSIYSFILLFFHPFILSSIHLFIFLFSTSIFLFSIQFHSFNPSIHTSIHPSITHTAPWSSGHSACSAARANPLSSLMPLSRPSPRKPYSFFFPSFLLFSFFPSFLLSFFPSFLLFLFLFASFFFRKMSKNNNIFSIIMIYCSYM